MQGTAMVLMTILGCDDSVTQCHYVETVEREWASKRIAGSVAGPS